jgi:branched-chain amino acid transport system permease protein
VTSELAEITQQPPAPNGARTRVSRWPRFVTPSPLKPPVYRRHHYSAIVAVLVAIAFLGPLFANSRSANNLLDLWLVYSIAGIGFYWIFGLAGRFAFCQTLMMALGAYTSAWITRSGGGHGVMLGLLGALVAPALLAALIGFLVRRASDLYFAIATLSVTQVGLVVFRRWQGFAGADGTIVAIKPLSFRGRDLLQDTDVFWYFLAALGVTLLLAAWIERSPMRREAIAARDHATVARAVGIPALRVQLLMFSLGSAFGGLSGALIGHWGGLISVDSFGVTLAIGLFLMLILGGAGSYWGPVIGAAFYVWMPEVLSNLDQWKQVIYGAVLLVTIIVLPDGLISLGARLRSLTGRPQPKGAPTSTLVRQVRNLFQRREQGNA